MTPSSCGIYRKEKSMSDKKVPPESKSRFPERVEYIISPEEALLIIHQTLAQIRNFRNERLYIFKTFIGPLVPDGIRNMLEKMQLNNFSIAYPALIQGMGNIANAMLMLDWEKKVKSVAENYRMVVLPYLELQFQNKVEDLKKNRPFGWRIICKFYKRNLDDISPLVDNLINLIALAWTFCPAIGEPEKETGYFNRFVFTGNGGFIDLGHFFNCAIIAYLYDTALANSRAEATEIQQRKMREKKWLVKMREKNYFRLITNLLWGYATSADTIEDRASDKLGTQLGNSIRHHHDNEKLLEYYIGFHSGMIKKSFSTARRSSKFRRLFEMVSIFFKNMFYTSHRSSVYDIENHMKIFFDAYDAIDPVKIPEDLLEQIVHFYTEKYFGENWDQYTCKDWHAVIPQDLWERVVRGREKFGQREIPIKIQLKDTGEMIDPYEG